jgi:hypothetical protein
MELQLRWMLNPGSFSLPTVRFGIALLAVMARSLLLDSHVSSYGVRAGLFHLTSGRFVDFLLGVFLMGGLVSKTLRFLGQSLTLTHYFVVLKQIVQVILPKFRARV